MIKSVNPPTQVAIIAFCDSIASMQLKEVPSEYRVGINTMSAIL